MQDRSWLIAGSVWVGLFVLGGLSLVVAVDGSPSISHYEYAVEGLIFSVVMTVLGSIILVHRPRQPIGLVLFITGIAVATQFGAGEYAVLAVAREWLMGAPAAWLATILRTPVFLVSFGLLLLLYPSGRPLGRSGRLLVAIAVVGAVAEGAGLAFRPGSLEDFPNIANPYGLEELRSVFPPLEVVVSLGIFAGYLGGIGTLAVRYRRSLGIERLQIKWVLFAAGAALTVLAALNLALPTQMESVLGHVAWTLGPLSIPATMALAVIRFRLFEIDRIISRTLSYGLVTAVLVGVYLCTVFVLGTLIPSQGELAVAGSTLLAAALFNPVRRRIQNAVDRKFNRSRFDAESTMEALSRRLANEVDLSTLGLELERVAYQTMQPANVQVWVRGTRG
jgi:hypothetical protein